MEVELILSVTELANVSVVLLLRVLSCIEVFPVRTQFVAVIEIELDRLLSIFFVLPIHYH